MPAQPRGLAEQVLAVIKDQQQTSRRRTPPRALRVPADHPSAAHPGPPRLRWHPCRVRHRAQPYEAHSVRELALQVTRYLDRQPGFFPRTPPGPVIVTSRCSSTSLPSLLASRPRPTKLVSGVQGPAALSGSARATQRSLARRDRAQAAATSQGASPSPESGGLARAGQVHDACLSCSGTLVLMGGTGGRRVGQGPRDRLRRYRRAAPVHSGPRAGTRAGPGQPDRRRLR